MNDEQDRNEETRPECPRHGLEDMKQQKTVQQVPEQVGEMIPSRGQAVEPVVQHERQPGERNPGRAVVGREGPADAVPLKSRLDVIICRHVERIIPYDEVIVPNLAVNQEGDEDEEEVKGEILPDSFGRKSIRRHRGRHIDLPQGRGSFHVYSPNPAPMRGQALTTVRCTREDLRGRLAG